MVKSKLLLKGILHPADAELAIRAGVDGIMVSNHGGRNLDTVIPPIEALPDIAQQVGVVRPNPRKFRQAVCNNISGSNRIESII